MAISWICNQFTGGVQSTQRIKSINKQIHNKVNQSTLCDLMVNINGCVKEEELFEIEPTIGCQCCVTDYLDRWTYLTPIMLG
ncbi:unnamed protein product [Rhizophagus irregularis]|nr:unnamed protein product [Rhizophagus irregularis]